MAQPAAQRNEGRWVGRQLGRMQCEWVGGYLGGQVGGCASHAEVKSILVFATLGASVCTASAELHSFPTPHTAVQNHLTVSYRYVKRMRTMQRGNATSPQLQLLQPTQCTVVQVAQQVGISPHMVQAKTAQSVAHALQQLRHRAIVGCSARRVAGDGEPQLAASREGPAECVGGVMCVHA
jgi:hypothetical protein